MVTNLLTLLALLAQTIPPVLPSTFASYRFECRLENSAHAISTLRGKTGVGLRNASRLAPDASSYHYELREAYLEHTTSGFAGRPQVGLIRAPGPPAILMAYSADDRQTRIQIVPPVAEETPFFVHIWSDRTEERGSCRVEPDQESEGSR